MRTGTGAKVSQSFADVVEALATAEQCEPLAHGWKLTGGHDTDGEALTVVVRFGPAAVDVEAIDEVT